MKYIYPDLEQLIDEMAEGDDEFKSELIQAIYNGLMELKTKYAEGAADQDEFKIQQIRHKAKPTLGMFGFEDLLNETQLGKEIIEQAGFGNLFEEHFRRLSEKLSLAIERVKGLSQYSE